MKQLKENQFTWLVTGAAGFIGSHLCENLLHLNQIVIGMDDLSSGRKENVIELTGKLPQHQRNNWTFALSDIRDLSACHRVMKNVDFVLHHAAIASVPYSIKAPLHSHAVNLGGFLNILVAAKEAGVKRVVYASSSAIYGDCGDELKEESNVGSLLSPYAADKYANEKYAKMFSQCYGLETIGLRYFNIFGPRQDPNGPYAAVIPIWINAAINKQPFIINGDGQNTRDFCFVDNVVQVNLLAALSENSLATSESFNVASGTTISLMQLYHYIAKEFGYNPPILYQKERPGDIRYSAASINKAERLLEFVPNTFFLNGLQKTIGWYKYRYKKIQERVFG